VRATLLTITLVATGLAASACQSDEPRRDDAKLASLLAELSDDPRAARAFLTSSEDAAAREEAAEAGAPDTGRVAWLVSEHELTAASVDDAAAVLVAATTRQTGSADAQGQVAEIVRQVLHTAGRPDDDVTTTRDLRGPLADAVAANIRWAYDDLQSAASRSQEWPESPERAFLIEVGADRDAYALLTRALETEVRRRLDAIPEQEDPRREGEAIGRRFGRLTGALTLGAADAAGDRRGDVFAEGSQRVAGVLEAWAEPRGLDAEARTALGNAVAKEVTREFQ
jgi:hypothetical protein